MRNGLRHLLNLGLGLQARRLARALVAEMLLLVVCQVAESGERLEAARLLAFKRFLSGVDPHVRLEVSIFREALVADLALEGLLA